jgi:hypothetical protein
MNNLRNILVLLIVCAGVLVFYSCEKENVKPVVYNEQIALNFNVFNDDGILNFETIADYEAAIDYLVTLESENNLDLFDETLGFISYRSKYKNNTKKMDDIQDDILATFLNPDLKVVIENNIFEVDMPNESVTVLAFNECELKSSSSDYLVGIFGTNEDVIYLLTNNLKSVAGSDYCDSGKEKVKDLGLAVGEHNDYLVNYNMTTKYVKGGIYFTLNTRIRQQLTKAKVKIHVPVCWYTPRNKEKVTKSGHSESGNNWERNYRPYWGVRRLEDFNFQVKFTSSYQGFSSSLNYTQTLSCEK